MHHACRWTSRVIASTQTVHVRQCWCPLSRADVSLRQFRSLSRRQIARSQSAASVYQLNRIRLANTACAASMDADVSAVIKRVHDHPAQAVLYATGGGMQALTWLLTVPGASRTVLESRVPYAQSALQDVLKRSTSGYASKATADSMAKAAYQQAAQLSQLGSFIIGIGCTCALMTDRVKKGDHKAFISAHTGTATHSYSLKLDKGERDRLGEDAVASKLLLNALAAACGLPGDCRADLGLLAGRESVQEELTEMADPVEELLQGRVRTVEYSNGRVVVDAPRSGPVYMAGSFNPLHQGHRGMLAAAIKARQSGAGEVQGCYELSVGNADKGLMPMGEVKRRVQQFVDENLPLVLTQAPLYPDKAKLFANSTFVIGYDTTARLVMPKYYGGHDGMLLQLANMSYQGCSVIVAGRVATDDEGNKHFKTLADVDVPEAIQKLVSSA